MPRRSRSRASRGGRRRRRRSPSDDDDERGSDDSRGREEIGEPYQIEILQGRHQPALPIFHVAVADDLATQGQQQSDAPARPVPHVCARPGEGYAVRVTNRSRRHIACAVFVDGENALLKDGSLIVAPGDKRELPGYLVSKNFVGREYVKEYRDFRFGKPKVVETSGGSSASNASANAAEASFKVYGLVTCDVYEAVLDEEVDSDKELRGQTTFYRGAGVNGSNEERKVPEGKKTHLLYSSVTVQGPRSSIANSTRGRWWIRGPRKLKTLEIRYREAHSLMLQGVDPRDLGLVARCKDEERDADRKLFKKEEDEDSDGKEEKEEKLEDEDNIKRPGTGLIDVCDLTAGDDDGTWTTREAAPRAEPVDIGT